jgi:2-octaprenyl-6-methoxyphenol hydroxylase
MHYDLVIVGGGLVGAGLAVALRNASLRIALIDARKPNHEDPRLFALSVSSCQFLKNLGLWSKLAANASPIRQVHVSHQGYLSAVRLRCEDHQLPSLGHVIPAAFIEAALNAELQSETLTLIKPATLEKLEQDNGMATLILKTEVGEKILHAPIVIGADGTESTVRAQLNIPLTSFDYEQSAIVTKTLLQRSHKHIAYERFTAHGAIAMLPLINDECATIWTADTASVAKLIALSEEDFLQALQKEFGYRLGRLKKISQRHVFPLRMVRAEKMVDQCVFLLGNAAHTLHPIAAQGFNLALYEVAELVDRIMEKLTKQERFSAADLPPINALTRKQQAISIGVSHKLVSLFSKPSPLVSMALQFSMLGFDLLTPIKKKFIQRLTGQYGNVPRLLLSADQL